MNRRVLITGGSRGIGAACVRAFRALGDRVVFIYRSRTESADALCRETGASCIRADISDGGECVGAVRRALSVLGGADVLVNCAGIAEFSLFQDITDEMWERMISTDLTGAFRVSREVSRSMISEKSGKIVNVSSMWGEVGASCEVHYSAAKAGLIGMTKALAKELAPSGITVNCVSPGAIDTEMNSSLSADTLAAIAEETPLGRLGKPEEVAAAVVFLASDGASFITGQDLGVNGGLVI